MKKVKVYKRKLIVGFAFVFVLILLANLFSYRSISQFIEFENDVDRTLIILHELSEVESNLALLESNVRGHLITDRSHPIDLQYHRKDLLLHLQELKRLIRDSEQKIYLKELEWAVRERMKILDKKIYLLQNNRKSEAIALLHEGEGIFFMEQCQLLIYKMEKREELLMKARKREANAYSDEAKTIILLTTVLFLLLVIIFYKYLSTQYNKNWLLQEQIQEERKRLFSFLNSIPLGIIVIGQKGDLAFMNEMGRSMVGNQLPQSPTLENLASFKAFKPDGSALTVQEMPISRALMGEATKNLELIIKLGEKEVFFELNSSPIFNGDGEINYAISTFTDITTRKLSEQELKIEKEKADNLLQTQDRFIANISHEIRTPMNAIIGFANLLLRTNLNKQQREYSSAIRTSGETLLTIINDILDLSKIEAGMMSFETIPFSPRALIQSLLNILKQKAQEKQLKLKLDMDEKIPEVVLGDPIRLTQILLNLIDNAIKFTEVGEVKLVVELLNKDEKNSIIRFKIRDTGVGIPKDKLSSIYERFNQGNPDTTRKYGGSGLGLSIVKNLVELQQGTITTESVEGIGTTFYVTLAYANSEPGGVKKGLQEITGSSSFFEKSTKILLAEDNILNQKLAKAVLQNLGATVEIAGNGLEAIDKLKNNPYDLILMDLQMPEMDGYKASESIREKINKFIPIIAITAHAMPGEKQKCISYGMNDYISKPFNEKELREKIMYWLSETKKNHFKTGSSIIDLTYLKELSSTGPDFIIDILETFIAETPVYLKRLSVAIQEKDLKTIQYLAHTFKSSLGYLGLSDLYESFNKIESWAEGENIDAPYEREKECLEAILLEAIEQGQQELEKLK